MRYVLLLILVAVASVSVAQDCSEITKQKKGEMVYFESPQSDPLTFIKRKADGFGGGFYYVTFTTPSPIEINGQGMEVTLSNGMKIKKPKAKVSSDDFLKIHLYCTIDLTKEEVKMLSENTIIDFTMCDYKVKVEDGERYKGLMNCLVKQQF